MRNLILGVLSAIATQDNTMTGDSWNILNENPRCIKPSGDEVLIENLVISVPNQKKIDGAYYAISGSKLIYRLEPHQQTDVRIFDVAAIVGASSTRSFMLWHAGIFGRAVVFWIEKFEDRQSRMGILEVSPETLTVLCEGTIYR